MKRIWVKQFKNNRLISDHAAKIYGKVDEDGFFEDLLGSVMDALRQACDEMDIENPIWFESNKEEFQLRQKTAFGAGNFMERPAFDRLEIEVIECI